MNYVQRAEKILSAKIKVEKELLDLYILLVLTLGVNVSLEDVHDAWAIWKNNSDPNHKSLIPFNELPKKTQELDREYAEAIMETAVIIFGNLPRGLPRGF